MQFLRSTNTRERRLNVVIAAVPTAPKAHCRPQPKQPNEVLTQSGLGISRYTGSADRTILSPPNSTPKRKETKRKAAVQLPQILSLCEDVVMGVIRVRPELVAGPQIVPRLGHDLHQAQCIARGLGAGDRRARSRAPQASPPPGHRCGACCACSPHQAPRRRDSECCRERPG